MTIHSFIAQGTEIQSIDVQVHTRFQLPGFQILGLAGPEIQEARERIIAAFSSNELLFPRKKVIVNLAPSDMKKSGTGHDLAIAIAILTITPEYEHFFDHRTRLFAWGTLGLDGTVQPAGKIASLVELLCGDEGPTIVYLSLPDARHYSTLVDWRKHRHLSCPQNTEIRVIRRLKDIGRSKTEAAPSNLTRELPAIPSLLPLLPHQERVVHLSIVGRHHTLILGPKGVGKSQMLEWYRWLSPESSPDKTWQRILYEDHAKASNGFSGNLPIRSVHAQVKPAHLLGSWGPKGFKAGELSLSHGGILVADEFLEWHRDAKECLREPLQNKQTTITRVQGTARIDCDFQLIATGNLCPCGGLPSQFRAKKSSLRCSCNPKKVLDYLSRLSGPIADRIDLVSVFHQELHPSTMNLGTIADETVILAMKQRLEEDRKFALKKFGAVTGELSVHWLEKNFPKQPDFEKMIQSKTTSLRSRHKAMRLARTIQAVERKEELEISHLFEALSFRMET